jgi:hypothetical protein
VQDLTDMSATDQRIHKKPSACWQGDGGEHSLALVKNNLLVHLLTACPSAASWTKVDAGGGPFDARSVLKSSGWLLSLQIVAVAVARTH